MLSWREFSVLNPKLVGYMGKVRYICLTNLEDYTHVKFSRGESVLNVQLSCTFLYKNFYKCRVLKCKNCDFFKEYIHFQLSKQYKQVRNTYHNLRARNTYKL
jgi:hypothetical protein